MDILRLLENLEDLAVFQPKSIGKIAFGLKKDEIQMQITKIRSSLPNDLKQAAQTMRDSERIVDSAREDAQMTTENSRRESERVLTDARREAEKIMEHARVQQERMISESEVLKLAKAQSEEIRNSADRDAVQMRRGAETYAYDVLCQLETVVGRVAAAVEKGKNEISEPAAPQREKARA